MTDSACDISPEQEKEHDIKIMCFPITLGDKGFMERIDLTNEQFYEMIEASEELPKTAQVTVPRFLNGNPLRTQGSVTKFQHCEGIIPSSRKHHL